MNMNLEFKKYISRFSTSYQIVCVENRDYTGGSISISPVYQGIEAVQNIDFNKDNLKSLIESKTALLSGIYTKEDALYILCIQLIVILIPVTIIQLIQLQFILEII